VASFRFDSANESCDEFFTWFTETEERGHFRMVAEAE
jgi:hypothetical protein